VIKIQIFIGIAAYKYKKIVILTKYKRESMENFSNYIYKNVHYIYKFLLVFISLGAIIYLFPKEGKFKYEYEKNKAWAYENLVAPFDFPLVKTDEEIKKEKDSIRKNSPIFLRFISLDKNKSKQIIDNEIDALEIPYKQKRKLKKLNQQFLSEIYKRGFIKKIPVEFHGQKIYLIKNNSFKIVSSDEILTNDNIKNAGIFKADMNTKNLNLLLDIYAKKLDPNLVFASDLYQQKLNENINNINIYEGMIPKGKVIISKSEIVDSKKYRQLKSLQKAFQLQAHEANANYWIYTGYAILVAIVLTLLLLFLKKYRKEIYEDNSKLGLILFNMVLLVALTTFTINYDSSYIFVVPLAILPLILKAFFDARVGFFVHVLTILLLGFVVPNSFEFVFLQIMAGIVTILTVTELTKRSNLFTSVGNIILIYILGYFAFHLIHEGSISLINSKIILLFLLNGILTIALSHQLILIYEKLFGLISDVSLLEWSNTNSKLLKRLADKAPGTFNHSMQVAHLAEAAANEIGANSLLVRAGALYHDIGKMFNPFYFTENQTSGVNKHDDLEPEESAQIIINHVLDGVELARKNKLPDRLIDFIRTHHGTGLVQYFYKKALEKNPNVDKEKFRYPGPNPFSKETAILMMADSVEAASKSLREPTAEQIENFVDKIIDSQLKNGFFDYANITLKEISKIKKLLKKKLKNIYHLRVEYPE